MCHHMWHNLALVTWCHVSHVTEGAAPHVLNLSRDRQNIAWQEGNNRRVIHIFDSVARKFPFFWAIFWVKLYFANNFFLNSQGQKHNNIFINVFFKFLFCFGYSCVHRHITKFYSDSKKKKIMWHLLTYFVCEMCGTLQNCGKSSDILVICTSVNWQ